jgi:hypothetical protein
MAEKEITETSEAQIAVHWGEEVIMRPASNSSPRQI